MSKNIKFYKAQRLLLSSINFFQNNISFFNLYLHTYINIIFVYTYIFQNKQIITLFGIIIYTFCKKNYLAYN